MVLQKFYETAVESIRITRVFSVHLVISLLMAQIILLSDILLDTLQNL